MAFVLRTVSNRIYADFLMASRLPALRRLLNSFVDAGYRFISIDTFRNQTQTGDADPAERLVVLRHDVDTDSNTARRMWEIERELDIQGSYFFRLSTLDVPLMMEIARSGGHASYHYEELATIAKRNRVHSRLELEACRNEALEEFARNLGTIRHKTGLPIDIVASHGDFVNRRLGVPNWVILDDPTVRLRLGIELEAYDDVATSLVTSRHSDTGYPRYWIPNSPAAAISEGRRVIYLLVHPRHWRTARVTNVRDDAGRAWESLKFSLPTRHHLP